MWVGYVVAAVFELRIRGVADRVGIVDEFWRNVESSSLAR